MKKIKVSVTFFLEDSVPDDWDEDSIQFWVEENHCLDNYVRQLAKDIEENPGYCQTCFRGEAKYKKEAPAGVSEQ